MKILSKPNGNAEEYGKWSVNPYVGCPHECKYCYLKKGVWKNALGGNEPKLKKGLVSEDHAYHVAMAEILENREQIIKDGGLFMTFTSDPCVEQTRNLMFRIVHECIGHGVTPKEKIIPVTMLTKAADFCGYDVKEVLTRECAHRLFAWLTYIAMYKSEMLADRLAIGWTLTGRDDLEPNASPNAQRIEAMRYVSRMGMKTWASIEPVIDFPSSLTMVEQAIGAGCQHFKIGLLTENTRVCRSRFDVIECMSFIQDVTNITNGKATVYWKQSVRDLLNTVYTEAAIDEILDQPNAVDMDYSMFGER